MLVQRINHLLGVKQSLLVTSNDETIASNQHWQIGVDYEFADWGKSQLGRASEQTLNGGLVLNHLYINGVLFNLSCIRT